jgi:sialate O-acetylesterase
MMNNMLKVLFSLIVFGSVNMLYGTIVLPPYFADNMVLPAGKEISISGKSSEGEKIFLQISGENYVATANSNGLWNLIISPLTPQKNLSLKVSGSKSPAVLVKNIAVGEVFVCGGQSNMMVPVTYANDSGDFNYKADDYIRFYFKGKWRILNKKNHMNFQAVPFFFAVEYGRIVGKTIGVSVAAEGGTGIEAWLPGKEMPATLTGKKMKRLSMDKGVIAAGKADRTNPMRPYGKHRLAKWNLGRAYPSELFEKYVIPLKNMPVSAIIWYQGESNADSLTMASEYDRWLSQLINSWRHVIGNVMVLVVELPLYNSPTAESPECWDVLRKSQQRCVQSVPNSIMVKAYDLGDPGNIHPKRKRAMGKRIAETLKKSN